MSRRGGEEPELAQDSGARMDTYNDDENSDDYGSDADDPRYGELKNEDRLNVNLDDVIDDDDEDTINLQKGSGS